MARAPKTTRIADDTTQSAPQTTAPGDAPADTYDTNERVSSAPTDKAAAAAAGHKTVNAVEPVGTATWRTPANEGGTRSETYTATQPDGTEVTVTHNYDTGVTTTA